MFSDFGGGVCAARGGEQLGFTLIRLSMIRDVCDVDTNSILQVEGNASFPGIPLKVPRQEFEVPLALLS